MGRGVLLCAPGYFFFQAKSKEGSGWGKYQIPSIVADF